MAASGTCWPALAEQESHEFEPFRGGITSDMVDAAYDLLLRPRQQLCRLRAVLADNVARRYYGGVAYAKMATLYLDGVAALNNTSPRVGKGQAIYAEESYCWVHDAEITGGCDPHVDSYVARSQLVGWKPA